eukprot:UN02469
MKNFHTSHLISFSLLQDKIKIRETTYNFGIYYRRKSFECGLKTIVVKSFECGLKNSLIVPLKGGSKTI